MYSIETNVGLQELVTRCVFNQCGIFLFTNIIYKETSKLLVIYQTTNNLTNWKLQETKFSAVIKLLQLAENSDQTA